MLGVNIKFNNKKRFMIISCSMLSQDITILAIALCQTKDKIKQDYHNLSNW